MFTKRSLLALTFVPLVAWSVGIVAAGCGSSRSDDADVGDAGDGEGGVGEGGSFVDSGNPTETSECQRAAEAKSNVGCDYWPTVTFNSVRSYFDYAVVVANTGSEPADITVTGPNNVNKQAQVPPGELRKIYLPWVAALKGEDPKCLLSIYTGTPPENSVVQKRAAYHLQSNRPVIVYQFNPLEYKGAGGEGPSGGPKDWTDCRDKERLCFLDFGRQYCYSYSNDASLLLPSTAMTGNYRIGGLKLGYPVLAITGTQDGTTVQVKLAGSAMVRAGGGISATAGGNVITLQLDAGDVAELVGGEGSGVFLTQGDFSGTLVQADKPVQVLSGSHCANVPSGAPACDHLEETIPPAETLGKSYVVARPQGPNGNTVGQLVRIIGNQAQTTLTYDPQKPAGCPDTIGVGETVDCGIVNEDFTVTGSAEFLVVTFLQGGSVVDPADAGADAGPGSGRGDPSISTAVPVEQFRTDYVFLAPDDYDVSYAILTGPTDADVSIDGQKIAAAFDPIGAGGQGVARVQLGAGKGGAHTLLSNKAVGLQVMGYGAFTSYQVPGGLNAKQIAVAPPK